MNPSPIALTVASTLPTSKEYRELCVVVRKNLQQHILNPWYPRAIDNTKGGFHQNYAADWKPQQEDKRGIVYQSRLTWVASQAALRAPTGSEEKNRWQKSALHGLDYLSSTLWDATNGGFYFEVAPDGKPDTERHGEKNAYGVAFGIYASCAVYEATKDQRALELAQKAFDWLEAHSHDGRNGGYYEALTREGKPILSATVPGQRDPIGTQYGRKSMNTHIHLLEALTSLYAVAPSPKIMERLEEVFLLVRDKVAADEGYLNLYLTPSWEAIPGHDSFGHDIETAFLLTEAAHVIGNSDERTKAVARKLVDHALQYGWDTQHGGFYDEGTAEGQPTRTEKIWWTQAEGLNALLLMHTLYGKETSKYWDAFLKQWDFIERRQVDTKDNGWLGAVAADGTSERRGSKSDFWTDPYHQGRALFVVSETLEKLSKGSYPSH